MAWLDIPQTRRHWEVRWLFAFSFFFHSSVSPVLVPCFAFAVCKQGVVCLISCVFQGGFTLLENFRVAILFYFTRGLDPKKGLPGGLQTDGCLPLGSGSVA